jgi:hypothetical protein
MVKSIVRVRGILRGMNCTADCALLMWKEFSTTGRVFTRCRIVDDPKGLPDGPYTLSFAGHEVQTRKFEGNWMLTFLPAGIELQEAA